MDTRDTLIAYSEWLDSEGLIVPQVVGPGGDDRTHQTLAEEFIEFWETHPHTGTLAGREPVKGQAAADLSSDPHRP